MKKFFKTYMPFTFCEMKKNMAYQGSFYLFIICSILGSFISYYLWMAIYSSSPTGIIGGLSKNEMVVYVFMTYITGACACVSMAKTIGMQVQDGSVVMNLIKPIDYRMSLIAQGLGTSIYNFIVPSVFVWIGLEIYKAVSLGMGVTPVYRILLYLFSMLMSFFIYVLFDFVFGMISFCTTYLFGMLIIRNAVIAFLTGQLIPLSFFPEVMQRVFEYMPFSSMVYVPVMIYLGKYSGKELVFVLVRQLVWIVILYVIGSLLWKKITKRMIVLGG